MPSVVFFLFFLSGAAGLIFEVAWVRLFTPVFGGTIYATATVLAAFMGGLAFGAYEFGRWIDRRGDPLRVYALIEVGIGVYGLALPLLVRALAPLYALVYQVAGGPGWPVMAARIALALVMLAIPTALMGGTFPVLCAYLVPRRRDAKRAIGALYALNTAGAVVGCFGAGFILLARVGLYRTIAVAAVIDLFVAAVAWSVYRRREEREEPVEPESRAPSRPLLREERGSPLWVRRVVIAGFALSGFASLAYEVVWTRLLVFYVASSVYAFSMMLTVFLLGLALGGFLFERLFRGRVDLAVAFAVVELGIAALAVATLPLFLVLDEVRLVVPWLPPFWAKAVVAFARTAVILLPPATLIGIAFPMVSAMAVGQGGVVGRSAGAAYAANTLGAMVGPLVAGFVLIPELGLRWSTATLAGVNLLVGVAAWVAARRSFRPMLFLGRLAVAGGLGWAIFGGLPRWLTPQQFAAVFEPRSATRDPGGRVVYVFEGVGGTVTIEDYGDHRTLSIDGTNVAGTDLAFHTTQKLQAHLALLMHRQPKQVLQVGFGSGGTAYAASRHPLLRIDCVEISPAVLAVAPQFEETNHGVLKDPRVRVIIDDARSYIRNSGVQYDVILSDSIHPILAGNGALYTADYFRWCREGLKPGGVFSMWLPLYDLRPEDYRAILRSLREVFSEVIVWHTAVGRNQWSIVQGFMEPLRIDFTLMGERMAEPRVQEDLAAIGLEKPVDLLTLFHFGTREVESFVAGSDVLNTEDNGYIEFTAARLVENADRETNFARLYPGFCSARTTVRPYLVNPTARDDALAEALDATEEAQMRILRGRLWEVRGLNRRLAVREYDLALKADPSSTVARDLIAALGAERERLLDRAAESPGDMEVRIRLGDLFNAQGDFREALRWFSEAWQLEPDSSMALVCATASALCAGDPDRAVELANELERHHPFPQILPSIGVYRALAYLERRLNYSPDDAQALSEAGTLYLEIQAIDLAEERLTAALQIDPRNAAALRGLLRLYSLTRERDKAGEVANRLLSVAPNDPALSREVAVTLGALQDPFGLLAEPAPWMAAPEPGAGRDRFSRLMMTAMAAWGRREFDRAEALLEKAIRVRPSAREPYLELVLLHDVQREFAQAAAVVERRLVLYPDPDLPALRLKYERLAAAEDQTATPETVFEAGIACLNAGELERGIEYLFRVEKTYPEPVRLKTNIGTYYMLTGQYPRALEYFRSALAIDPGSKETLDRLNRLRMLWPGMPEGPPGSSGE